MTSDLVCDKHSLLSYLGLPDNYEPSPETSSILFLTKHLVQLSPQHLRFFSRLISAKERTAIPKIRNRRFIYAARNPKELQYDVARSRWPHLWQGNDFHYTDAAEAEKKWVEREFMDGRTKHVGKLGSLLGGYEEERETVRVRSRIRAEQQRTMLENDEEEDSDDELCDSSIEEDNSTGVRSTFERRVRECFIYGLLEDFEYDEVDWDDCLDDEVQRDIEERWFEEDD